MYKNKKILKIIGLILLIVPCVAWPMEKKTTVTTNSTNQSRNIRTFALDKINVDLSDEDDENSGQDVIIKDQVGPKKNQMASKFVVPQKFLEKFDLKPFISDKEAEDAFERLFKQENALVNGSCEVTASKHRNDLICFFQRLFRYVVAKDCKKKKLYTEALGLKIGNDGYLTMELLLLGQNMVLEHNACLFTLSIDPNHLYVKNQLCSIYKKRINPSPNKSARAFFPRILVVDNNSTEINQSSVANYRIKELTIRIREKDLWITNCRIILHEFIHHLQHILGMELGGICPRTISKKLSMYPVKFSMETDADLQSFKCHPSSDFLKRQCSISVNVPCSSSEGVEKIRDYWKLAKRCILNLDQAFPYLEGWACYAVLFHDQVILDKDEKQSIGNEIAAVYKEECENKQKGHLTFNALKNAADLADKGDDSVWCRLAKKFICSENYFDNQTNKIKKLWCNSYSVLTPQLKDKIINAKNYGSGSEKFFAIRKSLGLVPK